MKKLISIFLCLCFIFTLPGICLMSDAKGVSIRDGKTALMAQFPDGECPGELDYVYYSPVTDSSDTTKYPLVVWLHGRSSGSEPRKQLYSYDFSNWSSSEYQARFENAGGAFLLLPRSNASDNNWSNSMAGTVKATIDYFISQYPDNIDTSRIYVTGYSSGGTMTYKMMFTYPDFFAAGMPICGIYSPTPTELDKVADMSVWFFSCDLDPYPSANTLAVTTSFNYLSSVTSKKDGVRMTNFSQAVWADGSKSGAWKREHYIFDAVIYDMYMKDGVTPYLYSKTKDATGSTVTFNGENGVISWLSQQTLQTRSIDLSIWQKIINFFTGILLYIASIFR